MKSSRIATSTILSASALALVLMAQSAQANILVNNTGASPLCSPSEVKLGASAPPADGSADYCAGYFAAPSSPTDEAAKLNDVTDGADWTFVYKIESNANEGTGLFDGIQFALTASTFASDMGTWTISWADTNGGAPSNLPLYIDLGVSFKAGNAQAGGGIAYFLFDDFLLTNNPYSSAGSFDLVVDKDLSHESLFVRFGDGSSTDTDLPEPGVLLLLGAGLMGMGLARRRKPA